jgi:hypothetical protein
MIPLRVPDGLVIGALYAPDDAQFLEEDMVLVEFGAYGINVSWHPEHELAGEYFVTLYHGDWSNRLHSFATSDADLVKRFIEDTTRRFASGRPVAAFTAASDETIVSQKIEGSRRAYELV